MSQGKPHVLVDVYGVERQSFNDSSIEYYVAEVCDKGLRLPPPPKKEQSKGKHAQVKSEKPKRNGKEKTTEELIEEVDYDPTGLYETNEEEADAKLAMREQLKERGFSRKHVEFRRILMNVGD